MTATVGADETSPPATRPVNFPALDSMRAIASIAVLATHAAFWGGAYSQAVWGTALARLDVGVAIFFVLSGFLLSRPWFDQHSRGLPPPSTGRYLWKRALRIYPVYVVAVVAALTLLPGNRDASITLWLKTLMLANIYVDDRLPDGLTQMWSLATEVAFYLLLPALMWLALSRRRAWARSGNRLGLVVALLLMVNVVWLMDLSVRLDVGGSMIRLWLPSYLTWFGVGLVIGAGEVLVRSEGSGRGRRLAVLLQDMGRSPGTCWTAALAVFAIAATPVAGPADLTPPTLGAAMTKNLLYAVVAGLLILPGVFAAPQGVLMRTLAHPTLRHVGHLSYGLFCIHLVVLELVADWRGIELFRGRALELFCITLVVALAVSEALYRLVERPCLRWRNLRVGGSRSEATRAPKVNATNS